MKHDYKKALLRCSILAMIIGVVIIIVAVMENTALKDPDSASSHPGATDYLHQRETVYINGEPYIRRKGVSTLLFIGLDTYGKAMGSDSYNNSEKADFLALAVFDDERKCYTILHLNRDTMADVTMLDINGKEMGTVYEQLAIAHTYGDGLAVSCKNTAKAVSDYLYGIEIKNYISVTMDAISLITDYIGGVTVTIEEDMTAIDSEFTAGSTITLKGEKALKFVRARGQLEDSSNLARMKRQKQYIAAFFDALSAKKVTDTFIMGAFERVSEYSVTNCEASFFASAGRGLRDYTYKGAISPDGEAIVGEKYMEFYADEEDLLSIITDLFYERTDD